MHGRNKGRVAPQECFPYIARRLLTDNHPRTRAALHQLLYAVRPLLSCPMRSVGRVCASLMRVF